MRTIKVGDITEAVRKLCIDANYVLPYDISDELEQKVLNYGLLLKMYWGILLKIFVFLKKITYHLVRILEWFVCLLDRLIDTRRRILLYFCIRKSSFLLRSS